MTRAERDWIDAIEEWKAIPGYGGFYEVSNRGQIRATRRIVRKFSVLVGRVVDQVYEARLLHPNPGKHGHMSVHIGVNGKKYGLLVHRAVLLAFVGPCPEGMEACHNDGDPSNNRPENLRWDTHAANNADRKMHGRYAVGGEHPMSKLNAEQVCAIRQSTGTADEVAMQFGIYKSTVYKIRAKEIWKHIP